jgi:DNA topoisomerase I
MTDPEERWWRRNGDPETGFRYLKVGGGPLSSRAALARIEGLRIPPAWTNVHISPDAGRKVQAWGEDDAGRKQYLYSEAHVRERDRRKWKRVLRLGQALPRLRLRVNEDLQRPALEREAVLALVVRFIDQAWFRVGGERYAVENRTQGIATLRKSQLEVHDGMLVFTYLGKGRKDMRRVVVDEKALDFIERLLKLPGPRLFQYEGGNGKPGRIRAEAVNRYIKHAAGRRYTSKDLRTFGATVRAATILADMGPPNTPEEAEKNVLLCCRLVSQDLGNTREICRSAYIHPVVLDEYLAAGRTIGNSTGVTRCAVTGKPSDPISAEEGALIRFLASFG